jgi:hypothetical protein
MPELSVFDPVLRMAVKEKELVSIRHDQLKDQHPSNGLLAVIPLVDSEQHLHAVLAVKDMHFMAFQQKNLNVLALLGSYVGNQLSRSQGLGSSHAERFLTDVQTSLQFARQHHTPSVMLSLQFEPSEEGLQVARYACDGVRSLDASWLSSDHHQSPVLCLLFPLMNLSAGRAFLQRLDKAVNEEFAIKLSHIMQDSQIRALTSRDTLDSCKAFFNVHVTNAAFDSQSPLKGIDSAA